MPFIEGGTNFVWPERETEHVLLVTTQQHLLAFSPEMFKDILIERMLQGSSLDAAIQDLGTAIDQLIQAGGIVPGKDSGVYRIRDLQMEQEKGKFRGWVMLKLLIEASPSDFENALTLSDCQRTTYLMAQRGVSQHLMGEVLGVDHRTCGVHLKRAQQKLTYPHKEVS